MQTPERFSRVRVEEANYAGRRDENASSRASPDAQNRFKGTTIDEFSGSTGMPYNWIRSEHERLRDGLAGMDLDFRSALEEFPAAMLPIVKACGPGEGPFAADAGRIKQRRILLS